MTLQLITPPTYIGPRIVRDTSALTYTLDASGEYVAWIIQAPKTGTIDRAHFVATTKTTDGSGLRARIETVNASDGMPSGSLVGGSSEVTIGTVTANSWNRSGAGLAAAVTKGDLIAVKLLSPAGTTCNLIIRAAYSQPLGPGANPANYNFPYLVNAIPTAAKVAPGCMIFALEYDDGTTPTIATALPLSTLTGTNFSSSSTPDERGNLFQVPVPCRVIGVYHQAHFGGAATTYDIVLYDSGGSALGTISVDGDQLRTTSPQGLEHYFASAISLSAATDYRLVLKPTTTTSITAHHMVVDTATGGTRLREAMCGNNNTKLTTRTDAGAWTDTDDSVACLGVIVDQLDDGAGSGGGTVNLFRGKLG